MLPIFMILGTMIPDGETGPAGKTEIFPEESLTSMQVIESRNLSFSQGFMKVRLDRNPLRMGMVQRAGTKTQCLTWNTDTKQGEILDKVVVEIEDRGDGVFDGQTQEGLNLDLEECVQSYQRLKTA